MTKRWNVLGCLLVAVALTGCGAPLDGHAEKAAATYKEVMAEDRDYELYGIQLAAQSTAPETGAILIESAGAKAYNVFSTALRGLASRSLPEATDALQAAFDERTGAAKQMAGLALANGGDAAAAAWLKEVAEKEQAATNPDVLVFLGNHGEKDLAELNLYRRLDSEDEYVRDEAFMAMGQIQEEWAVELLKKGLAREIGPRRKQAIIAMGLTGRPELASEVVGFVNTQGLVLDAIESLGLMGNSEVVPTLQELAGHEDVLVQVISSVALLRLGDEATAMPVLETAAASSNETVKATLARQLHGMNGDAALGLLSTLAVDKSTVVARPALLVLENSGDSSMEGMVIGLLSDTNPDLVMAALDCLGAWGTAEAANAIVPLLKGQNAYLKLTAANAILEIRARHSKAA